MGLQPAYSASTHYYGLFNRHIIVGVMVRLSGIRSSAVVTGDQVLFPYFGFAKPPCCGTPHLVMTVDTYGYYTLHAGVDRFYYNSDGVCIGFTPLIYMKYLSSGTSPGDEAPFKNQIFTVYIPYTFVGVPVFTKNRTVSSSQIAYADWS